MRSNDTQANESTRLGEAISAYIQTLATEDRELTSRELSRFGRWLGTDVLVSRITAVDVSRYQEQFSESSVDLNRRLEPVKAFLTNLKTQKVTSINLGAHIRLRRPPARKRAPSERKDEPEQVRITERGFAALTEELKDLEERVRPEVTEQLRRAAADKDFRENAPYDAAKQRLAEVQTRINDIRKTLSAASIYTGNSTDTVDLGTKVTLHSLLDDELVVYTIVGPGEVSARDGRISTQSPVGSALMDRGVGEVVEVQTPVGPHSYRIEKIEPR
ncbi:MAG TPA: transcription elongation factor GreA [Chloroflexota bacterium]|nr:transcription elongation factor GreA [Chloroflexota bacterium]